MQRGISADLGARTIAGTEVGDRCSCPAHVAAIVDDLPVGSNDEPLPLR